MTGLQDILPFKLDLWMSSVQKLRQLAQLHMTTMTTMIAQCCFLANNPLEAPAHWHASNWQLWKSPWGREVDFFRRKCLPLGLRIDLTLILMAPKNGHEFLYFPPAGTHKVHTSKKGRMTETCWPGLDELWIIMMNLAAGPVCASKVVSQNHRSNARAQSLMSETAMLVTATWGMGWREVQGLQWRVWHFHLENKKLIQKGKSNMLQLNIDWFIDLEFPFPSSECWVLEKLILYLCTKAHCQEHV